MGERAPKIAVSHDSEEDSRQPPLDAEEVETDDQRRGRPDHAGDRFALGTEHLTEHLAAVHRDDRQQIEQALAEQGGIIARAAKQLGISRQALYRRMEFYGIATP